MKLKISTELLTNIRFFEKMCAISRSKIKFGHLSKLKYNVYGP